MKVLVMMVRALVLWFMLAILSALAIWCVGYRGPQGGWTLVAGTTIWLLLLALSILSWLWELKAGKKFMDFYFPPAERQRLHDMTLGYHANMVSMVTGELITLDRYGLPGAETLSDEELALKSAERRANLQAAIKEAEKDFYTHFDRFYAHKRALGLVYLKRDWRAYATSVERAKAG